MKATKNLKSDYGHLSGTFFLIGLVMALLFVHGAFCYTVYEKKGIQEVDSLEINFVEQVIIIEPVTSKKQIKMPIVKKETIAIIEKMPDEIEIPVGDPEIVPDETNQRNGLVISLEKNDSIEDTGEILDPIEVLSKEAGFKGGPEALNKFVKDNLKYPPMAIELELERRVMVQFVVYKDGTLRDIVILNPDMKYELLQNAALRLIEKMNEQRLWIPAEQRFRKVSVRFKLPLEFQF
jgi:protein TonB